MYLSASYILEKEQYDRRDQELERLCKQVRNLKLEVQGRCQVGVGEGIVVNLPKILATPWRVEGSFTTIVVPTNQGRDLVSLLIDCRIPPTNTSITVRRWMQ